MNGCVDSVSSIVTQPAAIALSETHVNESAPSASDGSATVTAGGGTPGYSYLWSPGNDTTATINNLSTGTYTVEVTDSNGCTDTLSVVITTLVGVSDLKEMNLEIFPNPTRGEVFLKIFAPTSGWLDVSVFETSGKKVFKNEYAVSGDFQTKLDLDELAQGLYILQITLNHQVIERKISILK